MRWARLLFMLTSFVCCESVKIGLSRTTPAQQPAFVGSLPTMMMVDGNSTNATTTPIPDAQANNNDTSATNLTTVSTLAPEPASVTNVTTSTTVTSATTATTLAPAATTTADEHEKKTKKKKEKKEKKRRRGNHDVQPAYYCPCDLKVSGVLQVIGIQCLNNCHRICYR